MLYRDVPDGAECRGQGADGPSCTCCRPAGGRVAAGSSPCCDCRQVGAAVGAMQDRLDVLGSQLRALQDTCLRRPAAHQQPVRQLVRPKA